MQLNQYPHSTDFVYKALCWGNGNRKGNMTARIAKNMESRKPAIQN